MNNTLDTESRLSLFQHAEAELWRQSDISERARKWIAELYEVNIDSKILNFPESFENNPHATLEQKNLEQLTSLQQKWEII